MIGNYFFSSSGAAAGYQIENSLRFGTGNNLSRTPSNNGGSVWTISAWIKNSAHDETFYLFSGNPSATGQSVRYDIYGWYSDGPMFYTGNGPGNEFSLYLGNIDYYYKFRDPSAWYHVVWQSSSTHATIFVNGVQVETKSRSQSNSYWNQNTQNWIGTYRSPSGATSGSFDGHMAEVHFVSGTAYGPTTFGEFDDNGVWRPIEVSLTTAQYGNNGFYLKFDSTATNGVGHDHSGNGNNWQANNVTSADYSTDSPTNNFATLNALAAWSTGHVNYGALSWSTNVAETVYPTWGLRSGKWYCEITFGGNNGWFGISTNNNKRLTYQSGYDVFIVIAGNSTVYSEHSTVATNTSATWGNGDVAGIAIDVDNKTCDIYKNGTLARRFTTFTQDGPYYLGFDREWNSSPVQTHYVNFGQKAFSYTKPSGYNSWCTDNLPAPAVANPSQYFNPVLWTGNGSSSSRTISGVGFQPDFIWIKGRTYSGSGHRLMDAVRGAGKMVQTNSDGAEFDDSANVPSFASDGFNLTTSGTSYNDSGDTYIAWSWKANGSGSSNTAGSISSTVSANPSAGFSIVTYTGGGSAGTVGHGLGVAPGMILLRSRTFTGYSWYVYHKGMSSSSYFFRLNTTAGETFSNDPFNGTAPTSTVFSVGGENKVNNHNYVAYCFADVENYCKIGTYVAYDNHPNNIYLNLGFKPRYFFLKGRNQTSNWCVFDTTRFPFNEDNVSNLQPNNTNVEPQNFPLQLLANGIKWNTAGTDVGHANQTYIYMAIAEHPFGGAGVSPATAR